MLYAYGWFHPKCFMEEIEDMIRRQGDSGEDQRMVDYHDRLHDERW
jgi:hypothetical protein